MCKIIIPSYHKGIKRILRIQIRFFSYRAYRFMLMCLLFYGHSLLQISALLLARQISRNKLDLILCPGNFRDTYFKRKKIFILNVFDARLKINGKIQGVASDLIYLQRAYPRFKRNVR